MSSPPCRRCGGRSLFPPLAATGIQHKAIPLPFLPSSLPLNLLFFTAYWTFTLFPGGLPSLSAIACRASSAERAVSGASLLRRGTVLHRNSAAATPHPQVPNDTDLTSSATMSDIVWYEGSVTPATCGVTITFGCCACAQERQRRASRLQPSRRTVAAAAAGKLPSGAKELRTPAHHGVFRWEGFLPHHVRRNAA